MNDEIKTKFPTKDDIDMTQQNEHNSSKFKSKIVTLLTLRKCFIKKIKIKKKYFPVL